MSFVILAVEALDVLCDLVLKATHHDKTPQQIEKIISDIRTDSKLLDLPQPKQTDFRNNV